MDLSKIISINGKPGLFRLISQAKNSFVVEDLEKRTKISISQQNQVSLLENIAMYTLEQELPLKEVFKNIAVLENFGKCISFKEPTAKLREYMEKVLPNYDKDKVYDSDLKKLFKWYNILLDANVINEESVKALEIKADEVNQEN